MIIPRMKISNDSFKTTNPGYKKVYRFYDRENGYALGDVITLADEVVSDYEYTLVHPVETWKRKTIQNYDKRELLVPIYQDGILVYSIPDIHESKEYCQREFESLYPEVVRLANPHEYYVDLSDELRELKNHFIEIYSNR